MNHPRALAALTRPLSEVLVDAVRRQTNSLARLRRLNSQEAHDDDQLMLPLSAEDGNSASSEPQHFVRPDEVAVAALLGRAFDNKRGALGNLLDSQSTTVIQVPAAEYVEPTARILRRHVAGPECLILDGDSLSLSETSIVALGSLAVFSRDGEAKTRLAAAGNAEFASAVQRRFSIVGIAVSERALPCNLVRMAENHIVVPPLDADAIAIVIKAITGRRPSKPLDPDLSRQTKLPHLVAAIRAGLGPARCVERLLRLNADGKDTSTPFLSDLQGLGEAREWGLNLVRDLKAHLAGTLPWSAVDRGVLLSSPPGCGKTLFARSLARTAGVHFVVTSYSEWQGHKEGHLGHLISSMRASFQDARSRGEPAILFIDEIDSIPSRGLNTQHDSWWAAVVNALLEQIDGFRRERIIVIGACNHPAKLDPALVRSGRLDKHIRIPLPNTPALAGILRSHLSEELAGVDLIPAAVAARGGTGADVERWVRTARRMARVAQRPLAFDDLVVAIRDGAADLPADVRRRVAYHEAGHAVVSIALDVAQLVSLSVNPTGGFAETALGEPVAQTRAYLEKYLACGLAGRAAEELVYGDVTAGAGGSERSDLSITTSLAVRMETSFGLGELGPIWVGEDTSQRDLLLFSDLRRAVRQTIEKAYVTAKELLTQKRLELDRLAKSLLLHGYLDRAEIDAAMAPPPLPTAPPSVPLRAPILCPLLPTEDPPAIVPDTVACE